MSGTIRVKCPSCSKSLKAPASVRGRRVECSTCGTTFKVSARTEAAPGASPPAPRKPVSAAGLGVAAAASVMGVDDVEVVEDFDEIPASGPPKRKPPAKPAPPVDDFEAIDDFDSFDDGFDDFGHANSGGDGYHDEFLDLPDGYEDGPTIRRPKSKKKKRREDSSYTSVYDEQRDRHSSRNNSEPRSMEGQVWDGSVIGGLAAMVIAVVWFFGAWAAGRFFPYTIILFFIGLVGFVRGLMD